MNSNRLRSSQKELAFLLIIFIFISVFIYFYRNSKPVQSAEGIVQSALSLPKSIIYSFGKTEEKNQLITLMKKNEELNQRMVNYELIKRDNEALKSQFQTVGILSQTLSAAKIIGFQGNSRMPTQLIINLGSADGLKKGMGVVFNKYLVGKIDTVSRHYSVVITTLNPNFQVLAKVPDTDATGLIVGKNDFLLLDRVVITDTLKKNSYVVSKGDVGNNGIGILPDLIIGKIGSISKNESAPFQSAEVIPIIDFAKLTDVFVMTSM